MAQELATAKGRFKLRKRFLALAAGLFGGLLVLWLARFEIGAILAREMLQERGIDITSMEINRLSPTRVSLSKVNLGQGAVRVESMDVQLAVAEGMGQALQVVTLSGVQTRVNWDGEKLSGGPLAWGGDTAENPPLTVREVLESWPIRRLELENLAVSVQTENGTHVLQVDGVVQRRVDGSLDVEDMTLQIGGPTATVALKASGALSPASNLSLAVTLKSALAGDSWGKIDRADGHIALSGNLSEITSFTGQADVNLSGTLASSGVRLDGSVEATFTDQGWRFLTAAKDSSGNAAASLEAVLETPEKADPALRLKAGLNVDALRLLPPEAALPPGVTGSVSAEVASTAPLGSWEALLAQWSAGKGLANAPEVTGSLEAENLTWPGLAAPLSAIGIVELRSDADHALFVTKGLSAKYGDMAFDVPKSETPLLSWSASSSEGGAQAFKLNVAVDVDGVMDDIDLRKGKATVKGQFTLGDVETPDHFDGVLSVTGDLETPQLSAKPFSLTHEGSLALGAEKELKGKSLFTADLQTGELRGDNLSLAVAGATHLPTAESLSFDGTVDLKGAVQNAGLTLTDINLNYRGKAALGDVLAVSGALGGSFSGKLAGVGEVAAVDLRFVADTGESEEGREFLLQDCATVTFQGISLDSGATLNDPLTLCFSAREAPLMVLTPQAVRIAGEVAVTAPEDLILKPVGMEPITLPAKDLRLSIAATADRTTGDTSLTAEVSPLSLRQPGWDIADGGITVDVAHGAEKSQTQIRLRDLRVAQTGQQKLVVPLVVSGDMDMDNALVKFTGRAVGANGRLDLRLKGNHAIAENTGEIHFEMRPLTVGKGGAKATDIFPILLGSAHIAQGTAAVDGTARWSEKGLRADATLDLTNWVMRLSPRATGIDGGVRLAGENISLTARGRPGKRGMATSGNVILKKVSLEALETIASGVNGKITLSSLWPLATPKGQKITIDEVDVGLPLTDGHVIFQAGRNASFTLEQARLGLFSGDVTVSDISFAPGKPIPPINLRVTGVDLAQLLALVESQEVEGTGLLDGILPLTVKDGDIAITDGRLVAREEGTFRYVPPAAGPNEATDMVADALSDLRYNQLTMTVNGTAGGDMAMLLNLKGHNPNFLGGHPVDLNFKIEGELLGLARQGARGFGLPADALRGLGRQK